MRVFTTCTTTSFDKGDNVILRSGCVLDPESSDDKVNVRTRKSIEQNYKNAPIMFATIIMIDDSGCQIDIE